MKKILLFAAMIAVVAAMVPAATFAWNAGDNQITVQSTNLTLADGATLPDTGPINDQWVYTVNSPFLASVTLPSGDVITGGAGGMWDQTAVITPLDYAWQGMWATNIPGGLAACREAYAYGAGSTAGIVSAQLYADNMDGRALAQVSTQKIFGGGGTNVAVVLYTYGPSFPMPPFTVSQQVKASLMGWTGWVDTFNVYPTGPGGSPNTIAMNWDWMTTTNTGNLPAAVVASLPMMGAMTMDVCTIGLTLAPLSMMDAYHFVSPQFETSIGGTPTPCIPESATIILISVGLIGLVGFALLKRRHAAITA